MYLSGDKSNFHSQNEMKSCIRTGELRLRDDISKLAGYRGTTYHVIRLRYRINTLTKIQHEFKNCQLRCGTFYLKAIAI